MSIAVPSAESGAERGAPAPRRVLPSRRQVTVVVLAALLVGAVIRPLVKNPYIEIAGELLFVAMMLLFAFTAAGAWRQSVLPRWLVQMAAIALAAMMSPFIVQMLTFGGDLSAFLGSKAHVRGYMLVATVGVIVGTLFALGALYTERARARALQTALERETLQRRAADTRLDLLTAQIQPHFLLNTLANVQELVESGSPRAVPVFRSLIEYLRAAMPHLQQGDATLGDEERLVRAYLDLMQMRMPDRLAFTVAIDPALRTMRFPADGPVDAGRERDPARHRSFVRQRQRGSRRPARGRADGAAVGGGHGRGPVRACGAGHGTGQPGRAPACLLRRRRARRAERRVAPWPAGDDPRAFAGLKRR